MYRALSCFEQFLLFVSAVSGCVSISAFASLFGVPVDIASSAVGTKICAITPGIKKCFIRIKELKSQLLRKSGNNMIK